MRYGLNIILAFAALLVCSVQSAKAQVPDDSPLPTRSCDPGCAVYVKAYCPSLSRFKPIMWVIYQGALRPSLVFQAGSYKIGTPDEPILQKDFDFQGKDIYPLVLTMLSQTADGKFRLDDDQSFQSKSRFIDVMVNDARSGAVLLDGIPSDSVDMGKLKYEVHLNNQSNIMASNVLSTTPHLKRIIMTPQPDPTDTSKQIWVVDLSCKSVASFPMLPAADHKNSTDLGPFAVRSAVATVFVDPFYPDPNQNPFQNQ